MPWMGLSASENPEVPQCPKNRGYHHGYLVGGLNPSEKYESQLG